MILIIILLLFILFVKVVIMNQMTMKFQKVNEGSLIKEESMLVPALGNIFIFIKNKFY